jgi:hypothetical protein
MNSNEEEGYYWNNLLTDYFENYMGKNRCSNC